MRRDLANDETYISPGTIQDAPPEIFPHTDEIGDGTDLDHFMEPDADINSEQLSPTIAIHRSTKYDPRQIPKLNCNDDHRYFFTSLSGYGLSGTNTYTIGGFWKSVTERLQRNYVPTQKVSSFT